MYIRYKLLLKRIFVINIFGVLEVIVCSLICFLFLLFLGEWFFIVVIIFFLFFIDFDNFFDDFCVIM